MVTKILTHSSNEELITDLFLDAIKGKTSRMKDPPILIGDYYFNAKRIVEAYKKISKRGSGASLTGVTIEGHVLRLYYDTKCGSGHYEIFSSYNA